MSLLVLLFVAVLIFSRLWQVLGQKMPHKPRKRTVFLDKRDVEIRKHVADPKAFYPGFDESLFLEGAEASFLMILKAHQAQDQKTLKPLVSPALLKTLLNNPIPKKPSDIYLTAVSIQHKHLEKNTAFVSVQFACDQIFDQETVPTQDVWTFKRNIKSDDPNWVLDGINSK